MKRSITILAAAILSLAAFSSCSNDPTVANGGQVSNGSQIQFKQIDRVGKPGVKELYLAYAQHIAFNASTPENDPATYGPQIATFVTTTGGRSAAIGAYVASLLTPDALVVNLNGTGSASYLGWETSPAAGAAGQIASSCNAAGSFGGRSLFDDVVSEMLGLTFGSLATTTTLSASATLPNVSTTAIPPDDGKETPGLANQEVACPATTAFNAQFPYLTEPH